MSAFVHFPERTNAIGYHTTGTGWVVRRFGDDAPGSHRRVRPSKSGSFNGKGGKLREKFGGDCCHYFFYAPKVGRAEQKNRGRLAKAPLKETQNQLKGQKDDLVICF